MKLPVKKKKIPRTISTMPNPDPTYVATLFAHATFFFQPQRMLRNICPPSKGKSRDEIKNQMTELIIAKYPVILITSTGHPK
jgi:hypothetical protein